MKTVDFLLRFLRRFEQGLLVILVLFMVLGSFLQVVLRDLFSAGLVWADPVLRYAVLWAGLLGAAVATDEERHFGADFADRFVSPRIMHWVKATVALIAAVVTVLLFLASKDFLEVAFDPTDRDVFDIPRRTFFLILPIGFALMAFHSLLRGVLHVRSFFTHDAKASS